MATFEYRAKDKSGITVTGTVDRPSEHEAVVAVREMGYFPLDIRAVGLSKPSRRQAGPLGWRQVADVFWTGVGVRTLALFYRQLAVLLASGMTVSEALRSIGARSHGRMRGIIYEAAESAQKGSPITETIARYPKVFGLLQLSMLGAGAAGGLLEPMVERLASYLEFELEVRRMVARALFYPALIVVFIILVPHIPTLVLSGFPDFAASLWSSLRVWVPWIIALLVFLKVAFQCRRVRFAWDFVKVQPPLIGTAARKVAMSRFSRAMAMLYSAGMTMGNVLEAAADACANLYIASAIKSVIPAVESGCGLTDSLARMHVLSPLVLDLLATGERTGDIDSVLHKAAEYLDKETEATLHKTTIALFVAAICVAGAVVAGMVARFYMGYFSEVMGGAGQ